MLLSHCPTDGVGKYLLSRVQQLTNKILTFPFAPPDNDGRPFAPTLHCPFVAIKQPVHCPASPAQSSDLCVAPLDFRNVAATMLRHVNQPLTCTTNLPQWSRQSAAPLIVHNEAATVQRHLRSTEKQALCCVAYRTQWSSRYAAPLTSKDSRVSWTSGVRHAPWTERLCEAS